MIEFIDWLVSGFATYGEHCFYYVDIDNDVS